MAYSELPKLKKNSVSTTIASPGINDTDTTIPVTELAVFYDSDSNLITKGIVIGYDNATETYAEEITITGASGTSGAGNLTGATRGVNADGTIGAAKAHIATTNIAVMFSTGIYENIRDNQIDHKTSIGAIEAELPSKATKTTATQSIYVDKAATGAGDGTSWTDAFTTIQAAIDSLPTILEHNVTIYVRKGSTAYDEAIIIRQTIGKGSITLRGEYYWYGECAAAATPSATKFNLTAADGAQIAAGDLIRVADDISSFIYTTVVASVDKGSDVWEIEISDALVSGNIGAGDYFTIVKTIIGSTTTPMTVTNTRNIFIYGLGITSSSSIGFYFQMKSFAYIFACIFDVDVANTIYSVGSELNIRFCHFKCQRAVRATRSSMITLGVTMAGYLNTFENSSGSSALIDVSNISSCDGGRIVAYHSGGTAILADGNSNVSIGNGTIMSGTVTGIIYKGNSNVYFGGTNDATTPSNTDGSYAYLS